MDGVFSSGNIENFENGEFGTGSPAYAFADVVPASAAPMLHNYREGSVFTPGALNFVYLPKFDTPIQTLSGNGVYRPVGVWNPFARQVYSMPTVTIQGFGGLQAGAFDLTPLIQDAESD